MEEEAASALYRLRTYLREKSWDTQESQHGVGSLHLKKKDCSVKTGSRQSRHRFIYLHIKFLRIRQNLSRKPAAIQKDAK